MAASSEPYSPMAFVASLGASIWHDNGLTIGSIDLHPSMWAAGTNRPRLGILAILADLVMSSPPSGMLAPTVDLRVELIGELPPTGRLRAVASMLRVGRRLAVGEAWLDVDGSRCARATATFVGPADPDARAPSLAASFAPTSTPPKRPESFEKLIELTHPEIGTTVVGSMWSIRNGPGQTIQGGVQAMIAEIAAEGSLGPKQWAAVDVDLRFLASVGAGPVVASSEVIMQDPASASVRVTLRDASDLDPDRLVAYAAIRCRHVERSGS